MQETRLLQRAHTIGMAKIRIQDELKETRRILMTPTVKEQLYKYIFSDGENPFEDVTNDYKIKYDVLENDMVSMLASIK